MPEDGGVVVRRTSILLLLSLVLALTGAASVHGQAVTGWLVGRALSTDGAELDGVQVTVSGAALQGVRSAATDSRGHFGFPTLPAGTYEVRLHQIGYAPIRVVRISVSSGITTDLGDIRLAPQAVELGEIVVSAAGPSVDPATVAAVTAFDSSAFLALPTDRNVRAVVPLAPQANPSAYGDGVNISGATGYENGWFVDGINVTDPSNADVGMNLPYNFVREVQVTTGGFDAQYGRAQGGLVNVVTNAGGNRFEGQVFGYFAGDALQATPLSGVGEVQVDGFQQYDVGLSASGPIKRDRLWFHAAYNPTFERRDAVIPGLPAQADSRESQLFATKLTGRLGTETDLSLTVLGDPSSRDFVGQAGPLPQFPATASDPRTVLGRVEDGGVAVAVQLRHQAGRRVSLAASLSRLDRWADNHPRSGATTDAAALARLDDHVSNSASGNYGSSTHNTTARTAAQVSATAVTGAHVLKAGAEFEANTVDYDLLGSYVFKDTTAAGAPPDTVYSWFRVAVTSQARNYIPTLYLQDSWQLSRVLRLNLGLRWDAQFMEGDVGEARSITDQLAPRLGLIVRPGGSEDEKFFAAAGRFYEQVPMNALAGWLSQFTQSLGTYPQNPLVDSSGGAGFELTQSGIPPDPSLRGQYHDEVAAGYQRRIGNRYRLGVRGTYRTLRWALEDAARDAVSPLVMGNPGRGVLDFVPRARREYGALELTFERADAGPLAFLASYVLSRSWGNYTGLFASDILATTTNSGPQFDYPEQTAHASGLLPNDRTHVLKLSGSYRFGFGFTAGTAVIVASGTPLNEYGTGPYPPYWTFEKPRGTAGRTPATWNAALRLAYDLRPGPAGRFRPRAVLDLLNLGNQRRPLTYDQTRYTLPGNAGSNPNYGAVTRYQAPLSARFGVLLGF
jgi:hypothetical protein